MKQSLASISPAYRATPRLLLVSLVILALAYQIRTPIVLEMEAADEEPYLRQGFYGPEEVDGLTYRWTSGDAQIDFPGVGSGVPLHLELSAQADHLATESPVAATISLNDQVVSRFTPEANLATYRFSLPADLLNIQGDVSLRLTSDTFVPQGSADQRSLGLLIDRIILAYGPGMIVPPVVVWALLAISVISIYGVGRAVGWDRRAVLSAGLLLIALALGVIVARPWLAYNSAWLAGTALCVWLVALRLRQTAQHEPGALPVPRLQSSSLKLIIAAFLAWRITLVILPIVGWDVVGIPECCPEVKPFRPTSWPQAAFETWHRWDALWYGSIAQGGYHYAGTDAASNVAFFPLFPLVNGVTSRLSGLPVEVSGPLLATLFALVACLALHRLAQRETGDAGTADRSVVYLLAFPAAYYLAIGYAEALYTVCVLAAFWWAREGRWPLCGAAAFLAGLTRLHGALLIVPFAYEYLRQRRFRLRGLRPDAISVLGAPLGVLAFFAYLGVQFGEPMAYFQTQFLFIKDTQPESLLTFPVATLTTYLHNTLTNIPSTEKIAIVCTTVLLLVLTLEVWVRLPRVYGIYMLTVALFSLTTGDLISMPRFVVPMFPGFIALAQMGERAWLDKVILIAFLMLQGVLALMFTKGYWIA